MWNTLPVLWFNPVLDVLVSLYLKLLSNKFFNYVGTCVILNKGVSFQISCFIMYQLFQSGCFALPANWTCPCLEYFYLLHLLNRIVEFYLLLCGFHFASFPQWFAAMWLLSYFLVLLKGFFLPVLTCLHYSILLSSFHLAFQGLAYSGVFPFHYFRSIHIHVGLI